MEIGLNSNILSFIIENSFYLLASPINGSVHSIYCLFKDRASVQNEQGEEDATGTDQYEQFVKQLDIIQRLDEYAILREDQETVRFINHNNLSLILDRITTPPSDRKVQEEEEEEKEEGGSNINDFKSTDLCQLKTHDEKLSLLNSLIKTTTTTNSNVKYDELLSYLNYENAGFQLVREKISLTTPKKPFIEICEDQTHSKQLAYTKNQNHTDDLMKCLETKIHFIPIIKSHNDISLGDCSYLDTCHKSDTCRYVHYLKHIPENLAIQKTQECEQFNGNIPFWEKISPYSRNGTVSNISREILDAQWVNCDVRTFDFNILGKFAAVIADPAWNIHMNLPYGTCNDTELLNLPLSNIQDEGILLLWVTGRAIEIGKESLAKWGYSLKNELIWVKTNQLSRTICTGRTGHWLNHSKEHLLVGVKGNPQWLNKGIDVDVIVSPSRETSRKPDELYDMVERLVGPHARKLEIFGRDHNLRKGWFTIGNQLSGVNILEHDVLKRYEASSRNK